MNSHTIKGLRQAFRAVGKFHTPPELAHKCANELRKYRTIRARTEATN